MVTSLSIVAIVVFATIGFALFGVRRFQMSPQEYIVGGRSFGTAFLWVLLAGEIYTSFTFLGMAGWTYGFGAPAYYILAYGACGYVIGYFLLPALWQVGKDRGLLTAADFFADRYNSRALGIGVGAVQFITVVPYVTLQISGLQVLLHIAGYGRVAGSAAAGVAFLLIAFFVFTAGLRGTAWASLIKDSFVLAAVAFAGIAIPIRFFGSPAGVVDRVLASHPHFLTLPPLTAPHGGLWYVSTVLLTSIGFYMGPHSMNAIYSARSGEALRRNAALLPLYQMLLLLVLFAGLTASILVPGLRGTHVDQSFLLVIAKFYPPWVLGLIVAAGALAALIPASAILLGAAGTFTKNVLGAFGVATDDTARVRAARISVLAIAVLALVFWLKEQQTLVELLLLYYNAVTQFMPGVVAAFCWRRATAWGVAAGISAGIILALILSASGAALWGINAGLIALLANVAVLVAVSLATPRRVTV
ncbi:MAG TPA: sodium:solute symporter family protein [Candidatus Tumulicola sp.]|jgi:SSS family solute:Na+ symporter